MSDLVAQIQAAFEADVKRMPLSVHAADQLPLSFESITDAWLTDILCSRYPGAAVIGHRLGPVDTGSSNRRKIALEYNKDGVNAGLPRSLFCKASHDLPNRIVLGMSDGALCEITFYDSMRPLLPIEAPKCHYAKLDRHSFNSMVVLEDLSVLDTTFCTHQTPITRARAESQMRLLGSMHGTSYSKPELQIALQKLPGWPAYFAKTLSFGMREGSENGVQAAQSAIPPRLFRRHGEIWSKTQASVDRHLELPHTLAHGDVHLKNWYITAADEMGLSDWQCATHGHWGRDLAYSIATALTVEDRRAWDRELVRYYLDRLHQAGGPKLSFDEGWIHYRQQLMSALTWWTVTLTPPPGLPAMQPRNITLEFIRRIATAIDDVDSLDSFT